MKSVFVCDVCVIYGRPELPGRMRRNVMKQRGDIKLFDKVECHGFMRWVGPEWKLVITDEYNFKGHFHSTTWKNGKYHNEDIEVNFEDEYRENTYYEFKEQEFAGIVVGFKDITTKSRIYAVTDDYPDGRQSAGCYKVSIGREPCALVAYGDNRKHIVPMWAINEELERNNYQVLGQWRL